MSIYELPDGFQGMETAPKDGVVNIVTTEGRYYSDTHPFPPYVIGWSPIVPPKKKRRFVVKERSDCFGPVGVWDERGNWVATEIPTRESAQAVADIYEQAYEVTK